MRKALAWKALNGMASVWKSNLSRDIKLRFFTATVESVLLYGCECWTLKDKLQKSLDGCYTRMLRAGAGAPDQSAINDCKLCIMYNVYLIQSETFKMKQINYSPLACIQCKLQK